MEQENLKELLDRFQDFVFIVARKIMADIKVQIDDDLTSDQHLMMRHINKSGACTSSKLAEVFHVNKSAITAIINRLTAKGYIERVPDERDRRVIYLRLTDRGNEVVAQGEEKIQKVVGLYLDQLEEDELAAFLRTIEKLATIVNEKG